MKKCISIFIALVFLIAMSAVFAGEPVAPYPPDSALTKLGKLLKPSMEQSRKKEKVPTKEEVGVPIYPGTYLMWIGSFGQSTLQGPAREGQGMVQG